MSRNDIVLLAWGSRSMSRVRLPRNASAAARLMAVVVLPTPPFWLAIATIIVAPASPPAARCHRGTVRPGEAGKTGDDPDARGPAGSRRGRMPEVREGGATPRQPAGGTAMTGIADG